MTDSNSVESTPHRVVVQTDTDHYRTAVTVRGTHHVIADEPVHEGGTDLGPNPYEYLLAGLGACTSITLRMYADRKGWPLESAVVYLTHQKVNANECEDCDTQVGRVDVITRDIELIGDLDDEQRQRLLEIADRCPVHRTLHSEIKVRSSLKNIS